MKRVRIPTGALIAGTAFAQVPTDGDAAGAWVPDQPPGVVSADEQLMTPFEGTAQASVMIVPTPVVGEEWTPNLERQFLRLAEKEAVEGLTPAERKNLDVLGEERNLLKTPRSGEEILKDFEARKLTFELLSAMDKYAKFHHARTPPRQTKRSTKA